MIVSTCLADASRSAPYLCSQLLQLLLFCSGARLRCRQRPLSQRRHLCLMVCQLGINIRCGGSSVLISAPAAADAETTVVASAAIPTELVELSRVHVGI